MIHEDPTALAARVKELTGREPALPIEVFEDTSAHMYIRGGSVIRVGGRDYYVMRSMIEARFGIEETPKYWVKHAVDLEDGSHKIVKLVFDEDFTARIGGVRIHLRRSPAKEAAFLEAVRGDGRFMQGFTVADRAGGIVRIIDLIQGKSLFDLVMALGTTHREYYFDVLPDVVVRLLPVMEAMAEAHARGLRHGDIRNDHVWVEESAGRFRWIDFDLEVDYADFDEWSMGNILVFVVGKGIHSISDARADARRYPAMTEPPGDGDAMAFYRYRVANLRKLFPWVSRDLNDLLVAFSVGHTGPCPTLAEQIAALRAFLAGC